MRYNKIHNTDLEVSEICLGTMTYGEQNTMSEGHEQMDYAIDHGVNFFDTAEMYAVPSTKENNGKTEKILGTWFEQSGKRDKVILATKITGPSRGLSYVADDLSFSSKRINEAIERSLRRMKTDYIDIYQLHWPERKSNFFGKRGYVHDKNEKKEQLFDQIVYDLNKKIDEGKIRHWGISNETPYGFMRYLAEADKTNSQRPISIQNPYNLLNRTYEVGLAEISMREKIGLLAYSPMAFGLLSGKFHKGNDTPDDRLNKYPQMARYNGDTTKMAAGEYLKVAEKHGISLAQLSLAFVCHQPFVTSCIIGATSMEQLKENIESAELSLNNSILSDIESIHNRIPNPAP